VARGSSSSSALIIQEADCEMNVQFSSSLSSYLPSLCSYYCLFSTSPSSATSFFLTYFLQSSSSSSSFFFSPSSFTYFFFLSSFQSSSFSPPNTSFIPSFTSRLIYFHLLSVLIFHFFSSFSSSFYSSFCSSSISGSDHLTLKTVFPDLNCQCSTIFGS